MAENKKTKTDPQKPGEHTMYDDIHNMFTEGSVEESQKIFRIAREGEAEAELTARDKKTDRIFIAAGILVLCIAIVAAGYAITHSDKDAVKQDSPVSTVQFPFRADYVNTFSISGLRTFEKIDAWKAFLAKVPQKGITAVVIQPTAVLPDVFMQNTGVKKLSGIGDVHTGIFGSDKTPFIIAEITDIDAATASVNSQIRDLSDGLEIFFGYQNLSAADRAELTIEPVVYQNQPMMKVIAHKKAAPAVESDSMNDGATAEDMLQDVVASLNALPDVQNGNFAADTSLFVYQFVRQKYIIIAPSEAAVVAAFNALQ